MSLSAVQEPIDLVAQALADGTRRGLLRLVRDGERSAGDLAEAFPRISRPAVSQHLRLLTDAGLVTVRPQGTRRYYRARPQGLGEVWTFIDEMWTDRLGRLKSEAESAERRRTESDHAFPARSPQ
ncbi:MAG: metalloregulator ArsR/SmtB family transcription factor [Anaerolineaceae bacterium]